MKFDNWEPLLAAYIANVRGDIGALGLCPCAKFACGAVEAQTGIDMHKPFAGKYEGELSAAKVLKRIGAGDLESTFDRYFVRRDNPSFAQRGDIVFDGNAVGVCIGRTALFVADSALTEYPRNLWVTAWASETAHA